PTELWSALEENGLTRALVPEDQGGAGLGWQDVYPVLHAAGYHAAPVPLAETIIAGWLLSQAGMTVPDGVISLAENEFALKLTGGEGAWRVSGQVDNVPWGGSAGHVLAVNGYAKQNKFILLEKDSLSARPDKNIGRDPRAAVRVFDATPAALADVPAKLNYDTVRHVGALARSVQMAGAISAVLDLCVKYAGDRVQFGRPLAKFQAIQHQLAGLAGEAAAAQIAAQYACRFVDVSGSTASAHPAICTAKIRSGESAGKAAAIGHQVHGAIGFTDEYRLHYLTRRLWSWRSEFGAESFWAAQLGEFITTRDAGDLWPYITSLPVE
ncbi:MAG: acyl-CoA/acyl-ACP dehydrogenase, partial [Alphaproteobacteria bacterium]|nr:acyl-CoA/acyl-ACP dehydrogenase [Alphaproteobacteria bacterium]